MIKRLCRILFVFTIIGAITLGLTGCIETETTKTITETTTKSDCTATETETETTTATETSTLFTSTIITIITPTPATIIPGANETVTTTVTETTMATETTKATETTTVTATPTPPDMSGMWTFIIDVTEAYGQCAGEEEEVPRSEQINIEQNGWDLTLSGFLGNPTNILTGGIALEDEVWIITVTGNYPEGLGTTIPTYRLEVNSGTDLSGVETWTWTGGVGTCPPGKSIITATKN